MNHAVLVAKNLARRKLRTFLMLVAIFIAFLLFAALEAFLHGLNAGENSSAADRLVTVNKINFTVPLPISYVDRVRDLKGVTHAASVKPSEVMQEVSKAVAVSGTMCMAAPQVSWAAL